MKPRSISPNVYLLGAIDWDRRLFESLTPLPDGTSYNAYLVRGSEATALLDTVDPEMSSVLFAQLAGVDRLDYVVVHHAEQDHSGSVPLVLERYPEAKVVCSPRCKGMLIDLMRVPEDRFITVEDGATISLGDKTLKFVYALWVHWPETMVTYLVEDQILFTCDLFGSHLATSRLFADEARVYEPARRYYAEIMQPFRTIIQRNLDKLSAYTLSMIAPSHGPPYRRPAFILDAYREWVASAPRNLVVLPYVSMHGSTKVMVDHLTDALIERGVAVERFSLANLDIGKLAAALVDAATIVFGAPTVLGGAHPTAAYAALLMNALKPKAKWLATIGSFGWGGRTPDQLAEILAGLKLESLAPVLCRGLPTEDDFAALDRLADTIAEKHSGLAEL